MCLYYYWYISISECSFESVSMQVWKKKEEYFKNSPQWTRVVFIFFNLQVYLLQHYFLLRQSKFIRFSKLDLRNWGFFNFLIRTFWLKRSLKFWNFNIIQDLKVITFLSTFEILPSMGSEKWDVMGWGGRPNHRHHYLKSVSAATTFDNTMIYIYIYI